MKKPKMERGIYAHPNYLKIPSYGRFWVMFDLNNGHPSGSGYIWIHSTRKEALEHRKLQLFDLKNSSLLKRLIYNIDVSKNNKESISKARRRKSSVHEMYSTDSTHH